LLNLHFTLLFYKQCLLKNGFYESLLHTDNVFSVFVCLASHSFTLVVLSIPFSQAVGACTISTNVFFRQQLQIKLSILVAVNSSFTFILLQLRVFSLTVWRWQRFWVRSIPMEHSQVHLDWFAFYNT